VTSWRRLLETAREEYGTTASVIDLTEAHGPRVAS